MGSADLLCLFFEHVQGSKLRFDQGQQPAFFGAHAPPVFDAVIVEPGQVECAVNTIQENFETDRSPVPCRGIHRDGQTHEDFRRRPRVRDRLGPAPVLAGGPVVERDDIRVALVGQKVPVELADGGAVNENEGNLTVPSRWARQPRQARNPTQNPFQQASVRQRRGPARLCQACLHGVLPDT